MKTGVTHRAASTILLTLLGCAILSAAALAVAGAQGQRATLSPSPTATAPAPSPSPTATPTPTIDLQISGTIRGRGGSGTKAWTMTIARARVGIPALGLWTRSDASGAYTLTVPAAQRRANLKLSVVARFYRPSAVVVGTADAQVNDVTLRVQPTRLRVSVVSGALRVARARVHVFGHVVTTDKNGIAVFAGLELKPHKRYGGVILKVGLYVPNGVSFVSRPGGLRQVHVGLHHKH
jgi:hypothetical protein